MRQKSHRNDKNKNVNQNEQWNKTFIEKRAKIVQY